METADSPKPTIFMRRQDVKGLMMTIPWCKWTMSATACVLLALGVTPSAAQVQNLLRNPGFEGEWGFELPDGSCPGGENYDYFYNCIPEVLAPTFWTPFWNEGSVPNSPDDNYRRPEFKVIPLQAPFLDPPRILEGFRATQYFGFWGPIDAGYYQQVSVTSGRRYRFGCWAHSWSSCGDNPFTSGLECSGGFPNEQVTFRAGIDPTGGTDFRSTHIVWGDGVHTYDQYAPVPSVTTIAQSDVITVFIRSVYMWGFKHNDSYVDQAELIAEGPHIDLTPTEIDRSVRVGNTLSSDTFTIRNTGTETLYYAISDNADWLSTTPTFGSSTSEPDTVTIHYDMADIPAGDYYATITVSSDGADNSPQYLVVHVQVETAAGDMDGDGDVDQQDFGLFQVCLSGPGVAQPDPACECAHLDDDEDVDQDDFSVFQNCMSGANVPADPNCDD